MISTFPDRTLMVSGCIVADGYESVRQALWPRRK
jgi:hypothetical protein